MKQEIEDEEALFAGERLTDKERAALEYKREVYRLAKAKQDAVEVRDIRYECERDVWDIRC